MANMDTVLFEQKQSEKNVAVKTAARPGEKKRSRFRFELWVVSVLALVCAIFAYESLAESFAPGLSIMEYLHSLGYMKGHAVAYEPGKGMWYLLGWTGSGMMVLMMLYSVRKRVAALSSFGSMRKWLSAHMALGLIGPLLVTFHTTFDFHGLIATSYWCMVVTVVFGIIGRYIYVQIPRSITGAELGVREIEKAIEDLDRESGKYMKGEGLSGLMKIMRGNPDEEKERGALSALFHIVRNDLANIWRVRELNKAIKTSGKLTRKERKKAVSLMKESASLIRRKNLLSTSHKLLNYWHVLHVPLAAVMFLILFIHVAVYYVFRAA